MSKRNKLRKQVEEQKPAAAVEPLKVGSHTFRVFQGIDAAFGAKIADYPPMSSVPAGLRSYENVVSSLFFRGGKLDDFGLSIKPTIDRNQAMTALRALLSSFDPKHEHKTAVVAWCLSEWCDGQPKAGAA